MWRKRPAVLPAAEQQPRPAGESLEQLLRRLQWTVLRPLASRLGGDERSLQRGAGIELTEVREYQPGDDVRHIDWNVSARTEQPYVREAQAERALDVWLIMDVSASVDWGTAQCVKRKRAAEFAAVASQLLARHGHRIAALLFAERPLAMVPPAHGRMHLLRLLSAARDEPQRHGLGQTDLAAALHYAQQLLRRRSLVLVISDFLAPAGWQAPLSRLAQRHEVIAVRVHDPREAELPNVGLITVEDPETGQQLEVNTRDRALRERFAAAARAQSEQLGTDLLRCGTEQLQLATDADILPPMVGLLEARRHRRRGRAVGSAGIDSLRGHFPESLARKES